MENLSIILGILGLIATLFGSFIAYITYISPITRFKWYLRKPENWEQLNKEAHLTIYRHKKQPGFQIITDWDDVVVDNFQEDWIRHYPDKDNNSSHWVILEANGIFLGKELFVSLDGGRGFVPAPKRSCRDTLCNEYDYYYNPFQVSLARIIGHYPLEKNLEEFMAKQNRPILFEKDLS